MSATSTTADHPAGSSKRRKTAAVGVMVLVALAGATSRTPAAAAEPTGPASQEAPPPVTVVALDPVLTCPPDVVGCIQLDPWSALWQNADGTGGAVIGCTFGIEPSAAASGRST